MNTMQPIIFNPVDAKEREMLLKYIARLESMRGKERAEKGVRPPFPRNIDDAVLYYTANESDGGRYGRAFEVLARYYLTGKVEPVHPQGCSDIRYGGYSLEVKSSAGTLTPYIYTSPDDIKTLYNDDSISTIARAKYIIYTPFPENISLQNIGIVRVYTQKRFLQAAEMSGNLVIRAKQGLYGLGLKQFYQSNRQTEKWLDALDGVPSVSVADFFNRYADKEGR